MALGLRVGEVRAIQKDCIVDGMVKIKRAFSDNRLKDTKTGVIREYQMTDYENEIIRIAGAKSVANISPFIFTRDDGKPYTNKNLNAIWREASEKTGIKIKLQNAMRHSLGCQMVDRGYSLDLVQEQLGHTDARTTRRYARGSEKTLTEARENIWTKIVPFGEQKIRLNLLKSWWRRRESNPREILQPCGLTNIYRMFTE
jgi:integrase